LPGSDPIPLRYGPVKGNVQRPERVWLVPMLATMMVQGMVALNLFALPVLAPQLALDLAVDASWISVYSAIVFASSIVSSLGAGAAVQRWGAVRTAQLCLVLASAAALLTAAGSLPLIVIAAIAVGLAFGPETPAASHLLAGVTTARNRPLIFSIKQSGIQFAGIGAGLLLPALLAFLSWQAIFLTIGILTVLTVATLEPLHTRYDVKSEEKVTRRVLPLADLLKLITENDALRWLAIAGFCFSAVQQSLNSFLVVHLVGNGDALAGAGAALAVAQVAGIAGRIGCGLMAERWIPTRWLLALMGVLMMLGAVGLAEAHGEWPRVAILCICALFGFSVAGWVGIFLAAVAKAAPQDRAGDATGGIMAASCAGLVLGPLMFGLIIAAGFDYGSGYLAMALLGLVGTCALAIPSAASAARPSPSDLRGHS